MVCIEHLHFICDSFWCSCKLYLLPGKVSPLLLFLEKYLPNAEWKLISIPAVRNELTYECCAGKYPDITFTVIVKRRSLFHLINLIFPMIMISMLTMLSFLLPAESGEDLSL